MDEFGNIEQLVKTTANNTAQPAAHVPSAPITMTPSTVQTNSLSSWKIHQESGSAGLSIDTHMYHVTDIYSTLIQFARENTNAITIYPNQADQQQKKPIWLVRNHSIFPNVRLSHFTSLRPNVNDGEDNEEDDDPIQLKHLIDQVDSEIDDENEVELLPEELSPILVQRLLSLYKNCLLYGAVQPFDLLFKEFLMDKAVLTPQFQLLYASIICHMLPHAFYWHPEIFESSMDEQTCVKLSIQYYKWAKKLLSSIYFDTPSLTTCHAICNLVLYHIENGNTSVVYIYSGMAVRMALSLQLYREDALDNIAQHQASFFPLLYKPPVVTVKQYARSLLWFMYFLDTASSHYHNKPYEIHLDDHVSTTTFFKNPPLSSAGVDEHQAFFQFIEFHTCQITRDIRRTIFTHPEETQTSYEAIERIEKRLIEFQEQLPKIDLDIHTNIWHRRCMFKQWIRHHGHWILIHQSYLPTPMSVQRCTTAAFALVELFDHWIVQVDCYFRPCVHELKQACEILLYHVDQDTPIKQKALEGLVRLVQVLLKTPVGEIARTRPFVQRVLVAIQENTHAVY